ncbi:MAG: anaerobic glycerol-3-phosphate dehydrogenase subunit B [Candidatus Freyarchaeota archaeon]
MDVDVLIIGCGMAGLVAARKTSEAKLSTLVIATGYGSTALSSGTIDLLGYFNGREVSKPMDTLDKFMKQNPNHPYTVVGAERILRAFREFREKYDSFITYEGSLEKNESLLTPLGLFKPTCLAQSSIMRGTRENLRDSKVLVAGFRNLSNHTPALIARSLRENWAIEADYIKLDRKEIQPIQLALLLEFHSDEIIKTLSKHSLGGYDCLALPPVLGIRRTAEIVSEFEDALGMRVFETMSFPPSIPGLRLQQLLEQPCAQNGVEIRLGWRAVKIKTSDQGCQTKAIENGDERIISSKAVILATGQVMRDEISVASEKNFQGTTNSILEYQVIDDRFRLVKNGESFENIFVAGSALSETNMTGLGVSLSTGYATAVEAIKFLRGA